MFKVDAFIKSVTKVGDYYVVEGRVGDRDTSVHIAAPDVEKLTRDAAYAMFARSLTRAVY